MHHKYLYTVFSLLVAIALVAGCDTITIFDVRLDKLLTPTATLKSGDSAAAEKGAKSDAKAAATAPTATPTPAPTATPTPAPTATPTPVKAVDLNGKWTGTLSISDVVVTADIPIPDPHDPAKPPQIIKKEDCERTLREQLGKPTPLVMEFQPQSASAGRVTIITTSQGEETKSQPLAYSLSGNKIVIDGVQQGYKIRFEGTVADAGANYALSGSVNITFEDKGAALLRLGGAFNVSKPK
ncbi:MAG: hypothetical protein HYX92_11350 [Chloroflexi bacterium]|nr:hypothetical protein [Chloroflexota bacterium]